MSIEDPTGSMMIGTHEATTGLSLDTIVLPLAGVSDADATCQAVRPYLSTTTEVIVVHVIDKTEGGIDSASIEQRKLRADRIFDRCRTLAPSVGRITNTLTYHTDVVGSILDTAENRNADAVVFTPRDAHRFVKLVSGDTAFDLIHRAACPVLIVPSSGSNA